MPKSATITGRCRQASNVMFDYLLRLGFVVDEETKGKEVRSISLPPEKRAAALAELGHAGSSTKTNCGSKLWPHDGENLPTQT
jgi:hypothetical protein